MIRLVLASASPARLATLRSAGVEPEVIVSGVDEDAVLAAAGALVPPDVALHLACAKAEAVASTPGAAGGLVLGCNSILELDADLHGKPRDASEARKRWHLMRGRTGALHTGHWLIDLRDGSSPHAVGATGTTTVHFANITDDEIDAYVATGEPLHVAGAFTIDGLGGPFVERIEGDHHNVVGVSLPLVRDLLAEINVPWPALWKNVDHL